LLHPLRQHLINVARDRGGDGAMAVARGGDDRGRLLAAKGGVVAGHELRRADHAAQADLRQAGPSNACITAPCLPIDPVANVLQSDAHFALRFRPDHMVGAVARELVIFDSGFPSSFTTRVIFAVFGSTSTRAKSRPAFLAALIARWTSSWRK